MSTAEITKQVAEASTRVDSKFIGGYYLLTILTGAFVLFFHGSFSFAVDLLVGVFYLAVTAFLYGLATPTNKSRNR
ncbi:MAG TPA: hypothetical protein VJP02_04425 [Candidatus Sulfotelmatobacter sp.]|nr:hypothetical protein [Candidatus Sulfotelmatobacter sp.]